MESIILKDNRKKESKLLLGLMVFCAVIGVAVSLAFYYMPESDTPLIDAIKIAVFFGMLLCVALYGYLYNIFYKIEVREEKIIVKSLFGTKEIQLCEPVHYTYKRYNKLSELYEFKFTVKGKIVKIYTHFYQELDEILKSKNKVKE